MHSKEHIKWLEENNLLDIAKNNAHHFRNVLKDCLGGEKEKVLVIGDQGFNNRHISALMAAGYYIAARDLGLKSELIIQLVKTSKDTADNTVVNAFDNLKDESIIALSLSNKLGSIKELSLSFREYIRKSNHRFASTMSMGYLTTQYYPYVINSIDIDYTKLQKKANQMKELMDGTKEIHVTTQLGTDLYIDVKGKDTIANAADYSSFGKGGNIPAGEVYIPPNGKHNVNGKVVIDASIRHMNGTSLVKEPVTLRIEKGSVVAIEGMQEARLLEKTIENAKERAKKPENVALIGELGIGINPRATLVGSTIIDEKVYNTAHVAIGSNAWFGGDIKTLIHLDQVFNKPNIFLDDKKMEY